MCEICVLPKKVIAAGIDSLKVLLTTSETNLQQITKLPREEISEIVQLAAEIVAASKFRKGALPISSLYFKFQIMFQMQHFIYHLGKE